MIIQTKFNTGEVVWDCITGDKKKIIGISINSISGKMCCSKEPRNETTILYYLEDHICTFGTYRKEDELMAV